VGVDAQLVVGRDALGDGDDDLDARIGGLEDRVRGEASLDEQTGIAPTSLRSGSCAGGIGRATVGVHLG
jgi:hypothetical protein